MHYLTRKYTFIVLALILMPALVILKTCLPASCFPTSTAPENSRTHDTIIIAPNAHLLLVEANETDTISADSHLFPKDSIPFSMPLFNALQNPTSPKDSIENTLYANIKLKKILDEYILRQKRVQKLLKEINISDETSTLLTDAQIDDLPQFLTVTSMEFRGLVQFISKELKRSDESSKQLSITGGLDSPSGKQYSSVNLSAPSFKNPYFRDALPLVETLASDTRQQRRANSSLFYDDVELPWIIKAPLRALSYMMAHALESAIFGIGLIVIISVLSGLRSSKQ